MTARRRFDLSLYLIADPAIAGEDRLRAIVAAAAAGGVTLVQLRAKQLSTRAFLALARQLKACSSRSACRSSSTTGSTSR
jgi:thiamine-phosphate pyrophosphorylase